MKKKDVPWDPQREWIDDLTPEERLHFLRRNYPEIPEQERIPYVVDYSERSAEEFVISGPVGGHPGPGRRFNSPGDALLWARSVYGPSARPVPGTELPEELVEAGLIEYKRWYIIVKPIGQQIPSPPDTTAD